MGWARITTGAAAAAAALGLSGCFVAADLDRFVQSDACDVSLTLAAFSFHAPPATPDGHVMEFRLVKPSSDGASPPSLRGLAIIDRVPGPDFTIRLPNAVAVDEGPFDVDFYADVDGNGTFTPKVEGLGGEDHSWVVDDICASSPVFFQHTGTFASFAEPVTAPNDLVIDFSNMPIGGGALEVQLVLTPAAGSDVGDRTIGLYRLDAVDGAGFTITLPGMIDPDPSLFYEIRIFADQNGNGTYEKPSSGGADVDQSWIVLASGAELAAGPLLFDHDQRTGDLEDITQVLVTIP